MKCQDWRRPPGGGPHVLVHHRRTVLLGAVMLAGWAWPATRASAQQPSGHVDVRQVQIAFLVSGNLGSGNLSFHGRTYPFSIGGLGVGGIGLSRLEATGAVYNLQRIDQFPGVYGQARTGIVVGDVSRGQLWLENTNGVKMHLRSRREGLALSMGADGIVVQMK